MKNIQRIYLLLILGILASCGGDDPKPLTEEEKQIKMLAKTWNLSTASVDGLDVEEWFSGLQLSFTESKSFTVENAVPPIWIASGTFELEKSGSNYVIKRSDGVDLLITTLNETSVSINMSYVADDNARTAGITGSYTFIFSAD
ncbi:hypothetical protein [Chryseotalea sanaruensis]|nr:hypothetical protein [Chryseotalea sanaruensis]